jgi:hypothetical protein
MWLWKERVTLKGWRTWEHLSYMYLSRRESGFSEGWLGQLGTLGVEVESGAKKAERAGIAVQARDKMVLSPGRSCRTGRGFYEPKHPPCLSLALQGHNTDPSSLSRAEQSQPQCYNT